MLVVVVLLLLLRLLLLVLVLARSIDVWRTLVVRLVLRLHSLVLLVLLVQVLHLLLLLHSLWCLLWSRVKLAGNRLLLVLSGLEGLRLRWPHRRQMLAWRQADADAFRIKRLYYIKSNSLKGFSKGLTGLARSYRPIQNCRCQSGSMEQDRNKVNL